MPTTELAPGFHRVEHVTKGGWSLVCHVLQLPRGGTLVHSPVRQALDEILKLGAPRFVLAPNHYHHLGIPPLVARAPGTTLVASDLAIPRLRRQSHLSYQPLAALDGWLPEGTKLRALPGTKNGEVLVTLRFGPETRWIVCDAMFHVNTPVTGLEGFVLRATGTVPGLRVGATFRLVGVANRAEVGKALLAAFEEDRPSHLHFSHGEPYAVGDGAEVRALLASRLS